MLGGPRHAAERERHAAPRVERCRASLCKNNNKRGMCSILHREDVPPKAIYLRNGVRGWGSKGGGGGGGRQYFCGGGAEGGGGVGVVGHTFDSARASHLGQLPQAHDLSYIICSINTCCIRSLSQTTLLICILKGEVLWKPALSLTLERRGAVWLSCGT